MWADKAPFSLTVYLSWAATDMPSISIVGMTCDARAFSSRSFFSFLSFAQIHRSSSTPISGWSSGLT